MAGARVSSRVHTKFSRWGTKQLKICFGFIFSFASYIMCESRWGLGGDT